MSVAGKSMTWTIQASSALTDLNKGTGEIYKAVGTTGDITGDDELALGILEVGADDGGHVTLNTIGVSKFVAGAAVGVGVGLTVTTSGYFIQATSGTALIGRNLDSAVGSGSVGTGLFNFATPSMLVNSNGII